MLRLLYIKIICVDINQSQDSQQNQLNELKQLLFNALEERFNLFKMIHTTLLRLQITRKEINGLTDDVSQQEITKCDTNINNILHKILQKDLEQNNQDTILQKDLEQNNQDTIDEQLRQYNKNPSYYIFSNCSEMCRKIYYNTSNSLMINNKLMINNNQLEVYHILCWLQLLDKHESEISDQKNFEYLMIPMIIFALKFYINNYHLQITQGEELIPQQSIVYFDKISLIPTLQQAIGYGVIYINNTQYSQLNETKQCEYLQFIKQLEFLLNFIKQQNDQHLGSENEEYNKQYQLNQFYCIKQQKFLDEKKQEINDNKK
jgi:hypothetical protein